MPFLYAVLMGALEGLTEFLPISSFGQIVFFEQFFGITPEPAMFFEALLHLGTLAGLIAVFYKDLGRLLGDSFDMLMEAINNLVIYFHNRRTGESFPYRRVIKTVHRKFTAMQLVTMIPSFLIGFSARRLVYLSKVSLVAPGFFLLINGIFLLVIDVSRAGGIRNPKTARYDSAMWIGICQGLCVFPGLSRLGFTMGAALLCSYRRKSALKYSLIAAFPAILGAFICELPAAFSSSLTSTDVWIYIAGMVTAALVSYFTIRIAIKITLNLKFRVFALYSFILGCIFLVRNLG